MKLFGFEINRANKINQEEKIKTFALPDNSDGALTIQSGSHYGVYVDLDGTIRNEIELIDRYRNMSLQPEIETAIDDIVNEAIVTDDKSQSIEVNADDVKLPENIKKKITEEFKYVLKLLNFGNNGHDIFRRWYIDGRLFYHVIIDEKSPSKGIQELRYIDPRKIRKIREIQKTKDQTGIDIIQRQNEYYIYNDRGVMGAYSNMGVKIAVDSIINVNSGLMDAKRSMVLSYLHKAIKPLNSLRMVEDASVIYRMSRAPERRIFYVDVGNMPTIKAEQYVKDIVNRYRNKLVYDSSTGEIKDDRKHMSMLEDFFLPRREGSKGTEISTLPGGANLGELEDVKYFQNKLYRSLGVPLSRLEPQTGFSLGRSTEITRDELKFTKFVQRLRNKFSTLFDDALRIQLVLKKICTVDEWNEFKEEIFYDFLKDNNFTELKDNELYTARVQLLAMMDPFVGKYFSTTWIKKNILKFNEDEIEEMDEEIAAEQEKYAPVDPNNPSGLPVLDTPPPTPAEALQQNQQSLINAPVADTIPVSGIEKDQMTDPLIDKSRNRFVNSTMEAM